jgi:O-antigen/teichoic acid export membrane protein
MPAAYSDTAVLGLCDAHVTVAADDTRLENRRDSRAAGIYVASRTVAMLLVVVTYIVATRLYGKLGYAYVAAIYLIYESAIAIGSLGLPDAVLTFIPRHRERSAAIVRQASFMLSIAAVPVTGVSMLAAAFMQKPDLDILPAVPWLALVLLIELPTQPAINQLIAHGRHILASVLFIAFAGLRTAAVMAPAMFDWSLHSIPALMAVLGVARLVAHLWIVHRLVPLPAGTSWWDKAEMKRILWFALPIGFGVTVGKLNPQIDKYAVQLMLSTESFSEYSAAAFEVPFVTLIPYAIGAVMQRRYVELFQAGRIDDLRALWYATVEKTMAIVVPMTVVLLVLAEDVIVLIAGKPFIAAALPFRIFTIVLFHRVAAYGPMLQATNQTRVLLLTSLSMLLSNLALTVPLTLLFGYPGPAMASVIACIPPWIITLLRIGDSLGGGVRAALPWRFYGRVLAVSGVLGGVLYFAHRALALHPAIGVPVALAGFGLLYLPAGYVIGVIKREDVHYLLRGVSLGMIK